MSDKLYLVSELGGNVRYRRALVRIEQLDVWIRASVVRIAWQNVRIEARSSKV
ncbi:hypothetical protein H0266_10305 [Halobacillus locisalis]|uniref:Uncharacterized protein n=1 Tax=Halobacillus locisalis TaxID=220753 RepID=A0A838CT93_9BACI|nr:hypothetical protein [Halobacillus locisalis]MBA2175287.1 hypothetical protein [Halobacillus locisalis]